jgi:hypothetical protein
MHVGATAPKASEACAVPQCCAGIVEVASGDDAAVYSVATCQSSARPWRICEVCFRESLTFSFLTQRMAGIYLSRWVFI